MIRLMAIIFLVVAEHYRAEGSHPITAALCYIGTWAMLLLWGKVHIDNRKEENHE